VLLFITVAMPYVMDYVRKRRGRREERLQDKTPQALTGEG
jgi:hypothetical protein